MAAFVIRRLGLGVISLVGASIMVFAMVNILGGDVVLSALLGGEGAVRIPQETVDQIRHQLGLDKPLVARYVEWIRSIGTGKMGYSYTEKTTVGKLIQRRIQPTIQLAVQAVVFAWLLGIPFGVLAALRRNSAVDYASRLVSVLGLSLPSFWVGLMVTWILATRFHWFPPLQYQLPWVNPWVSLQQTLAPSLVLAFVMMAYIARLSRASLLEVLQEDYVRTARAKGLREYRVVTRHVLKVALIPVLSLSGVHLGLLLGGTMVIETVFGIDGLGRMTIEAVVKRDAIIVQNSVLLLAFAFVIVNLAVDLLYGWFDPRIRRS